MRVFGIRIGVDPSWFLALFLFIWWLTDYYQSALPGGDDSAAFALATVSALLFFLSILLHELGHAVVAIRNGISIAGIDLWLFGGIAKMSQDTSSPGVEFRVAVAGPVVTLVIAILCAGLGMLAAGGANDYWNAVAFDAEGSAGGFVAMLSYLASINVVLLVFNLIPAFPLDGGRIARAIAWKVTGDRTTATNFAATIGPGLRLRPDRDRDRRPARSRDPAAREADFIGGLWFIFIGMFLGQAARSATYQTAVLSRIEGVTGGRRDGRRAGRDPRQHDRSGTRCTSTSCATATTGSRSWTTTGGSSGSSTASAPSGSPRTASPCSRSGRSCAARRTTCA